MWIPPCFSLRFLLTPLREGRLAGCRRIRRSARFLLTPLREGRRGKALRDVVQRWISTHAPAGGATHADTLFRELYTQHFYSRPCGRGDRKRRHARRDRSLHFYSRPCGRGDQLIEASGMTVQISTHAPAGGATSSWTPSPCSAYFYSRPCGRGDLRGSSRHSDCTGHFYSRPCGRGDQKRRRELALPVSISTHAPAGGATGRSFRCRKRLNPFLLTPLREGRRSGHARRDALRISTHAPAGGATIERHQRRICRDISTHAPAGGATLHC